MKKAILEHFGILLSLGITDSCQAHWQKLQDNLMLKWTAEDWPTAMMDIEEMDRAVSKV